ncbi:MAG TPA: arginine--tRNA ligase [Planctomycetes bacterium]|nr:arginine--tRNA ligase [Planctomycetota bacterium]
MSILGELGQRFRPLLTELVDDPDPLLDLVRPSQDPALGDYQANFAMPLGKRLGRPPRQLAQQLAAALAEDPMCHPPEVAGPGFINLRLRNSWIGQRLAQAAADPRLGIPRVENPRTYVVDYSSPNVAKPMHVGHIRSTVIGDCLCRVLRFLGHRVISDNHIGDWGTQFGMIIYGWRHFLDEEAYRREPVAELARLYRLVRRLIDYHEAKSRRADVTEQLAQQEAALEANRRAAGPQPDKRTAKMLRRMEATLARTRQQLEELDRTITQTETDPALARLLDAHRDVARAVLNETAKLHAGDEENRRLWRQFLPACLEEIESLYRRLGVSFDHTLGESFYHDRLEAIVQELLDRGVARESDGAVCVFLEGYDTPMLIRKRDGAFLYATTDLATLRYRMDTWNPDAILYVVDFRQSLHFQQLFATARRMGLDKVELVHVSFGTVMGEDGRPFRTREGDTVGLEGLLDEAVRRAARVVAGNDDAKPDGPELSPAERARIAEVVGIGALKYADLSQNRTSDYQFSYDKMLAMNGNTGTYMQYAYARVRSIFRKGNVDVEALRRDPAPVRLETPAERALGLELLRFGEALELTLKDYRPNQLTGYLFGLANHYSTFYEQCPVLKAEAPELRRSRLLLCDLTARTIQKGLELLGIDVVEKM